MTNPESKHNRRSWARIRYPVPGGRHAAGGEWAPGLDGSARARASASGRIVGDVRRSVELRRCRRRSPATRRVVLVACSAGPIRSRSLLRLARCAPALAIRVAVGPRGSRAPPRIRSGRGARSQRFARQLALPSTCAGSKRSTCGRSGWRARRDRRATRRSRSWRGSPAPIGSSTRTSSSGRTSRMDRLLGRCVARPARAVGRAGASAPPCSRGLRLVRAGVCAVATRSAPAAAPSCASAA